MAASIPTAIARVFVGVWFFRIQTILLLLLLYLYKEIPNLFNSYKNISGE
jgi:hypothetical protein